MTTARIFAYKGNVGVEIDEQGKFINDPFDGMQLGSVVSTDEIEISAEAKAIIYGAGREGGSFAELMLTEHADTAVAEHGRSSMCFFGPVGKVHLGADFKIGRTCTKSVLDHCTEVPNVVPQDYQEFIDSEDTAE